MPSSGYTAITFTANEQPTTAKWNLIGSNDSAFNLGTGLEDNVILTRHILAANVTAAKLKYGQVYRRQGGNATDPTIAGTTNYDLSATDLLIQTGLFTVTNGTGTNVTFPVAFSEKPLCFVTLASANTANCFVRFKEANCTLTTLNDIAVFNDTGGSVNNEVVSWMAIGKP